MSLRDSDALVIEADVAFSLPDPTTVTGRKYLLSNTANASIVVSSTGATPFATGGVNTATITMTAGQSIIYQSDGVRWTARSSGGRQTWSGTAVTNASGDAVIVFPVPFAATPVVEATAQAADGVAPIDLRITAISTTGVTIRARQAAAVSVALIGLTVLVATTPLVGLTVHVTANQAGGTP